MKLNSSNHSKYLILYHIVFCPKFRYKVLIEKQNLNIQSRLKDLIYNIANIYDFKIIEIEIMPDHIHLFVSTKPNTSLTNVVQIIKSITARRLFEEFTTLKQFYSRCGHLWSRGYFVCSVGNANSETIKNYIKNQKYK